MTKYFTFLFTVFIPSLLLSQTQITGKVVDGSGSPLPGANIFIKDSYDGISSGQDGTFTFTTEEKGEAILVVSFVGYKQHEEKLILDNKDLSVIITLEEDPAELGTVVISAGTFEASDENKGVILRPLDIVSTGSDADIYSTLETLPGTQQVGETEGLFVRGGSPSEAKTIVDEMVVQNPFFSSVPDIPARGRFSPMLFKGIVFSTGGYSAQYGQALSSTLVLKTQDLAPETITGVAIMPLGLGGSHSQRWENSSLSVEGFYSNLKPYFEIQKQKPDWYIAPRGYEFSANYRQKTSNSGMFKVFASTNIGDFSLYMQNLDNLSAKDYFKMDSRNYYFNSTYRDIFGEDWTFFAGTSYSYDIDKMDIASDKIDVGEKLGQGKISVSKNITGNSFLTFGGEVHNVIFENRFNELNADLDEVLAAGFVEADVFFTNDLAARIGVRAEHSKTLNKSNFAPRLSLAYRLGAVDQLNFAYGHFYQNPDKDFLLFSESFDFEKAEHYIFNFQHIDNDRTFRIEFYYKDYNHLAKGSLPGTYNYFDLPSVEFSNKGKGYAKGIDIFWRDRETIEGTDYWISYSYIDTKREFRNYPAMTYPTFATPHTFSVVAKHWFPSITTYAAITYSFATGRPYFNPNNPEFLGDRAKSYNNLSFNFSYLTTIFNSFTVVFFSIDNIPGFTNVFGYRYSSDGKVKAAIEPPALRNAMIGMFISLGQESPL